MSPGDHSLNRWVTLVKIFEGSFRILKVLHEELLGILLRILVKLFEKSLRIFKVLVQIIKDLLFSCHDLQGSAKILTMIFTILTRSWQENKRLLKTLARKQKILKDLGKKRPLKTFALRKLGSKQTTLVKIFEGSFKILGDLHENLSGS